MQITDAALREHFEPYGKVEEVKILTRPDGKLVGCGFVQFNLVQSAAKAIHHLNLKPLLGRPVIVDWAVPKTTFGKSGEGEGEKSAEEVEIKKEEPDDDDEAEQPKEDDTSLKEEEEENRSDDE